MLRKGKDADAVSIAKIHYRELRSDFLPSLGLHFLQMFYSHLFQSKQVILIVIDTDKHIHGFIAGAKDFSKTFKDIILKHFIQYSLILLPQVLKNPMLLKKIFETIKYTKREKSIPAAELVVIAIEKSHHRRGLGRMLVGELETEFRRQHINEYKVSTKASRPISNSFYRSLLFKKKREFLLYGGVINQYFKRIT